MLNRSLFNVHDFIFIGVVTLIVHYFASPLYRIVDNNPASSGDE